MPRKATQQQRATHSASISRNRHYGVQWGWCSNERSRHQRQHEARYRESAGLDRKPYLNGSGVWANPLRKPTLRQPCFAPGQEAEKVRY